jgi:sugar phosphate isomerase/epimerase
MNPLSRRSFLSTTAAGSAALLMNTPSLAQAAASTTSSAQLTMLNGMAGRDFETQAKTHVALGLKWMDLKDAMYGENINNLSIENAKTAAAIARDNGLGIFCFSTALCESDISVGESTYRQKHSATLDHVLKLADILEPKYIRLISAKLNPFPEGDRVMDVVERDYPWLFDVYGDFIDRIHAAGRKPLIENESHKVIFNRPEGILRFFQRLQRSNIVKYTWDVQNLWQMGVFPTIEVYRQLKPIIGCIHLKGGRTEGDGRELVYSSALEDASWPVAEIMREALADGVAPFVCLNPSHGKALPGYSMVNAMRRDIAFLRKEVSADL